MPRPSLSIIQAKRQAQGLCPCGCGERVPHPGPRTYATTACRNRAYRERIRSGDVIPQEERQRHAAERRARDLESEATRLEAEATALLRRAGHLRRRAAEEREDAQGQVRLFATPGQGARRRPR